MLAKSSVACVHSQPPLHNQTTVAFNHFYYYYELYIAKCAKFTVKLNDIHII